MYPPVQNGDNCRETIRQLLPVAVRVKLRSYKGHGATKTIVWTSTHAYCVLHRHACLRALRPIDMHETARCPTNCALVGAACNHTVAPYVCLGHETAANVSSLVHMLMWTADSDASPLGSAGVMETSPALSWSGCMCVALRPQIRTSFNFRFQAERAQHLLCGLFWGRVERPCRLEGLATEGAFTLNASMVAGISPRLFPRSRQSCVCVRVAPYDACEPARPTQADR